MTELPISRELADRLLGLARRKGMTLEELLTEFVNQHEQNHKSKYDSSRDPFILIAEGADELNLMDKPIRLRLILDSTAGFSPLPMG